MQFKSILTVVTDPARAEGAVTAAARIALADDGHLDVLSLGVDQTQLGYSYVESGTALAGWSLELAESDAKAAAAAAAAALAEQPPDLRWSGETVVAVAGRATEIVAEKAAFADLVVLPVAGSKAHAGLAEAVIEAALFQGSASVLIVPEGEKARLDYPPKRIVLAWNQSAAALNAARRALPLLKAAEFVDVTVVDPPLAGNERSDPGGPLCQFLARHGVKAGVTVLTRSLPNVSEVLAQHVIDRNADLLVMGAYSHSRLREAVLGGATRDILKGTKVPVFMAH